MADHQFYVYLSRQQGFNAANTDAVIGKNYCSCCMFRGSGAVLGAGYVHEDFLIVLAYFRQICVGLFQYCLYDVARTSTDLLVNTAHVFAKQTYAEQNYTHKKKSDGE